MDRPRLAILVGPTAVGKTAIALQLAQRFAAHIINADSLQLYRELDIGTAKPTLEERRLVPHHLIDVVSPPEPYDAARYGREARQIVARLHQQGILPLVVGGTGLYLKALLHGLFDTPPVPEALRRRLRQELHDLGLPALYERLLKIDPLTARRLHPQDTYRILRALEVLEATGQPLAALQAAHRFPASPYRTLKLGLTLPREELYERINLRVEAMLAQGWLTEVEGLLSRYPPDLKPLNSLGYRHLVAYLLGRLSFPAAVAAIKRDTRRYAKRQLTWFRADPEIIWFHPGQLKELAARLQEFWAPPPTPAAPSAPGSAP